MSILGGNQFEFQVKNQCLLRQKAFFDQFLKGQRTEVEFWPNVRYEVREGFHGGFWEHTDSWPPTETKFVKQYLHHSRLLQSFPTQFARTDSFDASRESDAGLAWDLIIKEETVLAGPAKLRLWAQTAASDDADLHVQLKKIDRNGIEVEFPWYGFYRSGAAHGWQRISMRELDEEKSTENWPILRLESHKKLEYGEIVPVDIEIISFSLHLKAGERLRLVIRGSDFLKAVPGDLIANHTNQNQGEVIIHYGGEYNSHLLLPLIPTIGTRALLPRPPPVRWYLAVLRKSGLTSQQMLYEYLDVHSSMTRKFMCRFPYALGYEQLYAFPADEYATPRRLLPFAPATFNDNLYDGFACLSFENLAAIKSSLNLPSYKAGARNHDFGQRTGTVSTLTMLRHEITFSSSLRSRHDVAVMLFTPDKASEKELDSRITLIQTIGSDSEMKLYRQSVSTISTEEEAQDITAGSPFEDMDFLGYKVVEEFVFCGVASALGFFTQYETQLKCFSSHSVAHIGRVNYVYDKWNNQTKTLDIGGSP